MLKERRIADLVSAPTSAVERDAPGRWRHLAARAGALAFLCCLGPAAAAPPLPHPGDFPVAAAWRRAPAASMAAAGRLALRSDLPERSVTLTVHVPENTPEGQQVYALVVPPEDWAWTEHIALTNQGAGIWTGSLSVPNGGLVRYVYDRWDEVSWGDAFKSTREAHGGSTRIEFRLLAVTPGLTSIEDLIETWADRRQAASTGDLVGHVVDSVSGRGVCDVEVTAAGLHTATDCDGYFELRALVAGSQRVTAHARDGRVSVAAQVVDVAAGQQSDVTLVVTPATKVAVTFAPALPADTPEQAVLRMSGSLSQVGMRPAPNASFPQPFLLPTSAIAPEGTAEITLDLYSGAYMEYCYTTLTFGSGAEVESQGGRRYRNLIVSEETSPVRDEIAAWRSPGFIELRFRASAPPGSPAGVPLSFGWFPMAPSADGAWYATFYSIPNTDVSYWYALGADNTQVDATPGVGSGGSRTIHVGEADLLVEDELTAWAASPAAVTAATGEPVTVDFRVSVPPETPDGAAVTLVGDRSEVAEGTPMTRQELNPWMYEASVTFQEGGELTYHYAIESTGQSSGDRTLALALTPHVQNDWIARWEDPAARFQTPARPGFLAGVYFPDYWGSEFRPLTGAALDSARRHNADWVALSSVWSYGALQPVPTLEPRQILAPSVLTPREDILAQAATAHARGFRVFLGPQFNPEVHPNWQQLLSGQLSDDWWNVWLAIAERFWMWNAQVAEEADVEVLMLPGFMFHVFAPAWAYSSEAYMASFDDAVTELIGKVRSVYGGKILINGGVSEFDFVGLADYVGVTTYDTGQPSLATDSSVAEWRAGYEALFADKVDPRWTRWGKPVVFYTVHVEPQTSTADANGEISQARQLEALYQTLEAREFLMGAFTWAYRYVEAPLAAESSIRGKRGEAVMAKYFERLAGTAAPEAGDVPVSSAVAVGGVLLALGMLVARSRAPLASLRTPGEGRKEALWRRPESPDDSGRWL
ncbi:MAG: hypothetical protein HYV63_31875 [Candidatus Schekmanbacteria bacterium]|nr:hypothetical protein [Candidatus Schekmanbacteria bacterium]